MKYKIIYQKSAAEFLRKKVSKGDALFLLEIIANRLGEVPEKFAIPLRGTLKGFWTLRIKKWRVVLLIRKKEILIIAIGLRKEIYQRILSKLN